MNAKGSAGIKVVALLLLVALIVVSSLFYKEMYINEATNQANIQDKQELSESFINDLEEFCDNARDLHSMTEVGTNQIEFRQKYTEVLSDFKSMFNKRPAGFEPVAVKKTVIAMQGWELAVGLWQASTESLSEYNTSGFVDPSTNVGQKIKQYGFDPRSYEFMGEVERHYSPEVHIPKLFTRAGRNWQQAEVVFSEYID